MNQRSANLVVILTCLAVGLTVASCAPRQQRTVRRIVVPKPAPVTTSAFYTSWGDHSIDTQMVNIGPRARRRWKPYFEAAGAGYPAASVTLVGLKRERRIRVYAGRSPSELKLIRSIPVTAASGVPGPKLREGDRQVPEGIYEVVSLNPNSRFHVALRLGYPNNFDRWMAERDHRSKLGGDIMIHGGDQSTGCLAVGDEAAEDLFVIAADAGVENVSVVIVPRDFRHTGETELMPGQAPWVHQLYADLALRLQSLPAPSPIVTGANTSKTKAGPPTR